MNKKNSAIKLIIYFVEPYRTGFERGLLLMEEPKIKLLAVMQHLVILNRKEVLLLRYSGYRGKGVE